MERAASEQPAVRTIVRNDIFRLNQKPKAKYGVFGWTQGQHKASIASNFTTYNFTLFYVDKLLNDKSNEVEIQSMGCQVLDAVLRRLEEQGIYVGDYTIQPFNQRFTDDCAGVYASVAMDVLTRSICADAFADFNNDFNNDFDVI